MKYRTLTILKRNFSFVLVLFLFSLTGTVAAQHHHDHENEDTALKMPGNEIFGTVQEVIRKLESDPNTDWSKVDLEALRQHLMDMKAFTEDVSVISKKRIKQGVELRVKPGTKRATAALKRLFSMHPKMLKKEKNWDMNAEPYNKKQWLITVTTEDESEVEKINALGYIGILAEGAHHQMHHWMTATGKMKMKK